ncbi:hypothetical protein H5410_042574 [Solanum commersonii]|uniref:Uncharacterized protein n=1 Tax=Solanum commersonii TaxID=4109 RepID=A0A9J5XY04_SOLCO|nr:hypothetical protein H5410_042574 [Solanum commersonii]
MLHGQNSYVEPTSSSSPMPRTVDPSQFCIDELQQKISSVTYQQKPQNSIGYDIDFLCFFALMLFGMAANLGKLKIELREAEDNLVKALADINTPPKNEEGIIDLKIPTLSCQMKEHGMSLDNPGSSLGTFQPPDGITSTIFLSEIDNETIVR